MSAKVDVELKNFFVFNSAYDVKEGEEIKKILYYYPPDEPINTKVNNVGLVEAIIKFTGNFKPNLPVSSLHTQKKRQLYFQPEPNYWMVLTLNLPYVTKTKNDNAYNDYLDEDVQNNVYEAVLQQAYAMFRLFSGTYKHIEDNTEISVLQSKLDTFYSAYLKTLKLTNCDILNVFSGIHFLPLDKINFLHIQCLVNMLECDFPLVCYVSFLFNDSLIWSGIEPTEMQAIYQYLIGTLLPASKETELQGGSIQRNQLSPFANLHYGRYITGPTNLKSASNVGKVPKIYFNDQNGLNQYHFIVYKAMSATICLFIDAKEELTVELFKNLDAFMGPKVSSIASDIAEYCTKNPTPALGSDSTPKFIYFNKLNLAYKSTVHLDNRQSGNLACTKDSLKIMADMNAHKPALGYAGETIVKTMNDYWVVGKVSNLREFYIALQHKNASLIDISASKSWLSSFFNKQTLVLDDILELNQVVEAVEDIRPKDCINVGANEVKKICDVELKGIFFHPM